MEKKYLYRMALVALWMTPLTSLQAAKAVEDRHVGLEDNRLRADRRDPDIIIAGAKAVKRGDEVRPDVTLDRAKAVKEDTVANWRDEINWNTGYTTAGS